MERFLDFQILYGTRPQCTIFQMRRSDATNAMNVQPFNNVASSPSVPVYAPVPACSQQGRLFEKRQLQISHKVLVIKLTAFQTPSDSVSKSEKSEPDRVRSFGLFELTFFGCHLTTLSSPYRSASAAILAVSNTWNLDLSLNLSKFSSAGCWNGVRPYESACRGVVNCLDAVVRMARDACKSTIRFPSHASMMVCFRREKPFVPRNANRSLNPLRP